MNEMKTIRILFVIVILLTLCSLALLTLHIISPEEKTITLPVKTTLTKQEITLKCEQISATATNKNWSYKNCIKNVFEANRDIKAL